MTKNKKKYVHEMIFPKKKNFPFFQSFKTFNFRCKKITIPQFCLLFLKNAHHAYSIDPTMIKVLKQDIFLKNCRPFAQRQARKSSYLMTNGGHSGCHTKLFKAELKASTFWSIYQCIFSFNYAEPCEKFVDNKLNKKNSYYLYRNM